MSSPRRLDSLTPGTSFYVRFTDGGTSGRLTLVALGIGSATVTEKLPARTFADNDGNVRTIHPTRRATVSLGSIVELAD